MAGRSQTESEQPAKVYQLDAVDKKVDEALGKLDTLLTQTSGLVTPAQLTASEKKLEEKLSEEVTKIHLEYRPMKRNIQWLLRTVLGQIIVLVIGAIFAYFVVFR